MPRLSLLIYIAFVAAAVAFFGQAEGERQRRPDPRSFAAPAAEAPPESPETGESDAFPAPSPGDPTVMVEPDKPCVEACTGTAFAIDTAGHWLTAKHVVHGCKVVGLLDRQRRLVEARTLYSHASADVSLLVAKRVAAPPLPLDAAGLRLSQTGYHFGFPRGEPGEVQGRFLGRVAVRRSSLRSRGEPAVAWAETDRNPDNNLPLGGLSGGPVLDPEGHVIGVAIAASPRRGRVISAAPVSLKQTVSRAGVALPSRSAAAARETNLDRRNYANYGNRLRQRLTVAQVICLSDAGVRLHRPRLR